MSINAIGQGCTPAAGGRRSLLMPSVASDLLTRLGGCS
jgi:hypothetical protein